MRKTGENHRALIAPLRDTAEVKPAPGGAPQNSDCVNEAEAVVARVTGEPPTRTGADQLGQSDSLKNDVHDLAARGLNRLQSGELTPDELSAVNELINEIRALTEASSSCCD
jgi:hypothetical protein